MRADSSFQTNARDSRQVQMDVNESGDERFHGLDASRGVLMSLGILLHCANIYRPGATGGITETETHSNWLIGLLGDSIHLFRMPAFFWVSGFFCAMTLYRRGAWALFQSRLPRLVIPFFATFLTLNLLQDIIVGISEGKSAGAVLADGIKPYHLWFLVNLTVYIGIAAFVFSRTSLQAKSWLSGWKPTRLRAFVLIVLTTYAVELTVRATGHAYYTVLGMVSPYSLATYAPYFAFGALMYRRLDLRDTFLTQPSWLFLPAVALGLIVQPMTVGDTTWRTEVAQIAKLALVWVCLGSLQTFFHRSFQRRNWFTEIAARSSYTVYLFHYVFVVALGAIFIRLALSPYLEFTVICLITLAATVGIHELLIERSDFLRFCFNGRWQRRVPIAADTTPLSFPVRRVLVVLVLGGALALVLGVAVLAMAALFHGSPEAAFAVFWPALLFPLGFLVFGAFSSFARRERSRVTLPAVADESIQFRTNPPACRGRP